MWVNAKRLYTEGSQDLLLVSVVGHQDDVVPPKGLDFLAVGHLGQVGDDRHVFATNRVEPRERGLRLVDEPLGRRRHPHLRYLGDHAAEVRHVHRGQVDARTRLHVARGQPRAHQEPRLRADHVDEPRRQVDHEQPVELAPVLRERWADGDGPDWPVELGQCAEELPGPVTRRPRRDHAEEPGHHHAASLSQTGRPRPATRRLGLGGALAFWVGLLDRVIRPCRC